MMRCDDTPQAEPAALQSRAAWLVTYRETLFLVLLLQDFQAVRDSPPLCTHAGVCAIQPPNARRTQSAVGIGAAHACAPESLLISGVKMKRFKLAGACAYCAPGEEVRDAPIRLPLGEPPGERVRNDILRYLGPKGGALAPSCAEGSGSGTNSQSRPRKR
jgi:hypothetical protein